jgi:hypothetical protein
MKKIRFCLISICLECFLACTVQKRTFNKGYFLQWNLKKNSEKVLVNADFNQNQKEIEESLNKGEKLIVSYKDLISTELIEENKQIVNPKFSLQDKFENKLVENQNFEKNAKNKISEIQAYPIVKEIKNKTKPTNKDSGVVVHTFLIVSLAISLLGIIFTIRGISTNYINWAFIPGLLLTLGGFLLFCFSILMAINWFVKKKKNKLPNKDLPKKNYLGFILAEIFLGLAVGIILLLAKLLL